MKLKNLHEITQNIINNIHDTLPDIDTKEGTFIRDVFINPTADQITSIYGDIKLVELAQSVLTASGEDLDKLANNYFLERKSATKSGGNLRFYLKNSGWSNLNLDDFPQIIVIPKNTEISTSQTYFRDPIHVKTTVTKSITKDEISNLRIDSTGLRYIEIPAISVNAGEINNVESGELINLMTNKEILEYVESISNPYNFQGGMDKEDDNSLALRISLAISGSNIGTKNGYLSYILKQNGVQGAKVIGAGDEMMLRDGGRYENGKYIPGTGGKVDIYIKGSRDKESTQEYIINSEGVVDTIILDKQPVNSISSIESVPLSPNNQKIYYKNAADYETENHLDGTIEYYQDQKWDFSIKDHFPDENLYCQPEVDNLTNLKTKVDDELKDLQPSLVNIHSRIDWGSVESKEDQNNNSYFNRYVFIDEDGQEKICKLVAKENDVLVGRQFVKKNNYIYVRKRSYPDYKLIKPIEDKNGNSIQQNCVLSRDSVQWFDYHAGKNNPIIPNDKLLIRYNYNHLISELQTNVNQVKVLTADGLIKQAISIQVEIILKAICEDNHDINTVRTNIQKNIITFIDTVKKIGGKFDRSDIITLARRTSGVYSVDVDSVRVRKLNENGDENKIETKENEYLRLNQDNLLVEVVPK
ncbi:MAG: baseplate J/gp47 family protein [bacterium]